MPAPVGTKLSINEFMDVYPELESIQEKLKDWFAAHPDDDITLIVPNPNKKLKREVKINYCPTYDCNVYSNCEEKIPE